MADIIQFPAWFIGKNITRGPDGEESQPLFTDEAWQGVCRFEYGGGVDLWSRGLIKTHVILLPSFLYAATWLAAAEELDMQMLITALRQRDADVERLLLEEEEAAAEWEVLQNTGDSRHVSD